MLKRVLLLILITLSFILTGCGDNPKSLVRSGIDDKSGVKISEVYNKKKGDEQTKFAKEITVAYFEQAKVDMSKEFKPDFHHYKLDDSLGDLLSRIDSGDSNFKNLRKLHQLFQRRRTDGDKILALHRQLGLGSNRGDLRYDNAGPIDEYTLYIFHTVPFSDLQPVYAAIGYQVIGNEYVGRHVMPDVNNYLAMVHVPKNGSFFTQGQGVYTFYAAQAGEVKFKDAAGFERNLPLLQLIPDGQVGAVRQFINLHKTRVEMQDILIPQFINNVLAEPGGEFQTGVASIDNQTFTAGNNSSNTNQKSNQPVSLNQTFIDNGYVNGVGVNLRKEPSLEAEVIRGLDHSNVQVTSFTTDNSGREWAQVRLLDDGSIGYIAKEYFKHSTSGYRKDTEPSIGQGHIVGTGVIMRNGQAREADPIGEFNNGESVEILKYVNTPNGEQWVRVRRNNGKKGFVFGKYLKRE